MDNYKDEEHELLSDEEKQKEKKGALLSGLDNIFSDRKSGLEDENKSSDLKDKESDDDNHYIDKRKLKRMNFGLWLSESRPSINKIITVILIIISVGFFAYSLYSLGVYLKAGDPNLEINDDNLILIKNEIKPLVFSEISVLPNNLKNDLAILVSNENPRFYAKFDYCFKRGEVEIECGTSFILPGQKKHIIAFANDAYLGEGDYQFSVSKISWNRISREILDYPAYHKERLDFLIDDLSFKAAAGSLSSNIDLNALEFSVINNTAFSYHQVPLNILIYSEQKLIGVNRQVLEKFRTAQERKVNLNWPGDLRGANRVEVIPVIDIFNESVFLKYQGS